MSSINQLSEASTVSSSMQIPVFDTNNGQPRKISVNQLTEYMQDQILTTARPLNLYSGTTAELNSSYPAASYTGAVAYVTDGNSGAACLAVSDGSSWKRIALGTTISP
jgi:hypothetical protein